MSCAKGTITVLYNTAAPRPTMRLRSGKPIVNRKYRKSKTHLLQFDHMTGSARRLAAVAERLHHRKVETS